MLLLELILMFLLQFEGSSGWRTDLYHRVGDEAVLPCNIHHPYNCSDVDWSHTSNFEWEVEKGEVSQSSPRASRLSLNSKCSLIINNIKDEDAGRYYCQLSDADRHYRYVYLNVLTVSPSDVDPKKHGDVTLTCSLWRDSWLPSCPKNSLQWVDETGSQLFDEDDGYKFRGQRVCVSVLTVKLQNDENRRFTCRFVEGGRVKIEAHYTPVFTDSSDWSPLSSIMMTLRISVLILMIGLTVGVIRTRGSKKPLKDISVHYVADDDTVSYGDVGAGSAAPTLN